MDAASTLVAIAGAFLLAGFVKGVIGLGLPTVSIGLLGLLMTPAQAAAILVVPSLVTNIWQAAVGGGLLALARRLWPLLAGICIGTAVGVAFLPRDDNGRATVWLGLALAIYAALGLVNVEFSVPRHAETWLGLLMGAATGAITVATGIFVMPGTHYIQSMEFDHDKLVQALGLSFTVSTITLAAALAPIPGTCKHRSLGLQLSRSSRRLSGWAWDNSRAAKSRLKPSGCVSLSD
jgi:uncharacterized protein